MTWPEREARRWVEGGCAREQPHRSRQPAGRVSGVAAKSNLEIEISNLVGMLSCDSIPHASFMSSVTGVSVQPSLLRRCVGGRAPRAEVAVTTLRLYYPLPPPPCGVPH